MKIFLRAMIFVSMIFFLASCGSKGVNYTFKFEAEKNINNGVLLPVDIIAASAPVMESVIAVGPEEWFGDKTRERLVEGELYPLAISGGTVREKRFKAGKDLNRIIVYADFANNQDRSAQQVVINRKGRKRKYLILVKENELELKQ